MTATQAEKLLRRAGLTETAIRTTIASCSRDADEILHRMQADGHSDGFALRASTKGFAEMIRHELAQPR